MKKVTRRALLGGAVAAAGIGTLETLSFTGRFDHRNAPAPSGADRYRQSITEAAPGIVHVGHSTHLIVVGGMRFLTDPWFYDPAFGALEHAPAPAVAAPLVGALDGVLITHDHADHADLRALAQLDTRAWAVVATAEFAQKLKAIGYRKTKVLALWESFSIGPAVVTAVPAVHDIYEVGYVVSAAGKSVYFAGDTKLIPDGLRAIASRLKPDAAILPVDGTRLTGGALHVMTPEDAVEAARILGSPLVMPSHAEAVFSDPIAAHVLASTVANAGPKFGAAMAEALPSIRCVVPAPGDRIALG